MSDKIFPPQTVRLEFPDPTGESKGFSFISAAPLSHAQRTALVDTELGKPEFGRILFFGMMPGRAAIEDPEIAKVDKGILGNYKALRELFGKLRAVYKKMCWERDMLYLKLTTDGVDAADILAKNPYVDPEEGKAK